MSANIVLPNNSDWIKQRIESLYQAKTQDDFNEAFDNFISKNAKSFTFNGEKLTRDEYKQKIQDQRVLERSTFIFFQGVVDSPPLNAKSGGDAVSDETIRQLGSTIVANHDLLCSPKHSSVYFSMLPLWRALSSMTPLRSTTQLRP